LGYFTRWGDGACDVFPHGGLHKVEVRGLGEILGVPEKILKRPYSPGFFAGHTAEGEMGFTYEQVYDYFHGGKLPAEAKKKIEYRLKRSTHKLKTPPAFQPKR